MRSLVIAVHPSVFSAWISLLVDIVRHRNTGLSLFHVNASSLTNINALHKGNKVIRYRRLLAFRVKASFVHAHVMVNGMPRRNRKLDP